MLQCYLGMFNEVPLFRMGAGLLRDNGITAACQNDSL